MHRVDMLDKTRKKNCWCTEIFSIIVHGLPEEAWDKMVVAKCSTCIFLIQREFDPKGCVDKRSWKKAGEPTW